MHKTKQVSLTLFLQLYTCDELRNLAPFVQFKNMKNTHGRVLTLLKVTLLHGCFSRFVNCTNCTKSRNVSHMLLSTIIFSYYYVTLILTKFLMFGQKILSFRTNVFWNLKRVCKFIK